MNHNAYNSNTSQSSEISNKSPSTNSKMKKFDHLFKIVIIGDSGVGKSCLLLRFADDQFSENFYSTIGVDFRFKCISVKKKEIKLQIWDTAGQERFKTITSAYYRGADGIILVYDQTDKNSFWHLNDWLGEIDNLTTDNPIKIVIANKSDIADKAVTEADVKEFSNRTGIEVIETSAKNSYQVYHAFEKITNLLISRVEKSKFNEASNTSHKLTPTPMEGRLKDKANNCCK